MLGVSVYRPHQAVEQAPDFVNLLVQGTILRLSYLFEAQREFEMSIEFQQRAARVCQKLLKLLC